MNEEDSLKMTDDEFLTLNIITSPVFFTWPNPCKKPDKILSEMALAKYIRKFREKQALWLTCEPDYLIEKLSDKVEKLKESKQISELIDCLNYVLMIGSRLLKESKKDVTIDHSEETDKKYQVTKKDSEGYSVSFEGNDGFKQWAHDTLKSLGESDEDIEQFMKEKFDEKESGD